MGKKKWLAALFAVVLVAGMTAMLADSGVCRSGDRYCR